jgi:hypothetical protein
MCMHRRKRTIRHWIVNYRLSPQSQRPGTWVSSSIRMRICFHSDSPQVISTVQPMQLTAYRTDINLADNSADPRWQQPFVSNLTMRPRVDIVVLHTGAWTAQNYKHTLVCCTLQAPFVSATTPGHTVTQSTRPSSTHSPYSPTIPACIHRNRGASIH